MPTLSLPLDITKPAVEILMDAINAENRSSYDYNDFVFGTPEVASLPKSDINTKLLLTPKVTSAYINSREIFYRRITMQEIYESSQIEINVGARLLLSDVIDEINAYYGINLTDDDYVDQTLPQASSQNPGARLTVILQATADSVLFTGSAEIILNEPAPVIDNDNVERKYFITVDNEDTTVYTNKVICVKGDLTPVPTFAALKNATAITTFNVVHSQQLSNGNILLMGEFEFTAAIGSDPSAAHVVAKVVIDPAGNALQATTDDIFGPPSVGNWFTHWNGNYVYIIDVDDEIATSDAQVYRYDLAGVLDTGWDATGIAYVPTALAVDRNNKVYCVSPQYTDVTVKKIRIDRLLATGAIDNTFTPVILAVTGGGDPLEVVDIQVVDTGGFYIALKPVVGVSSLDPAPIINDVPVIPGNNTQIYAFNPVFKFLETGDKDPQFNNELKNNASVSIYKPIGSNMQTGDRVITPYAGGVGFFTHIQNPITGFEHRTPMGFDNKGAPLRISGNAYASQIRWDSARQMIHQSNGRMVVWGKAMLRASGGGWTDLKSIVALYLTSGELDDIIYTAPASAGPLLEIRGVTIMQLDY